MKRRRRAASLSDSEIMTILLYFHFGTFFNSCSFLIWVRSEGCTGITFVDSKGFVTDGKGTMGWFHGFKLHLACNDRGEIIAFVLTGANVCDRDPAVLKVLAKRLYGKCCLRTNSPEYTQLETDILARGKKNRFLVQVGDTYHPIVTTDVAFFYSEEKYTYLHLFNGRRHIVNYPLDQLEQMVDSELFYRVSHNCIANIRSIQKISKYFTGRLKLHFTPVCPHEIIVSRNRAEDFLNWMDGSH